MTKKIKKEEKTLPKTQAKKGEKKEKYWPGVGRRKRAVASCRLYAKGGESLINEKKASEYFPSASLFGLAFSPLKLTNTSSNLKASIKVAGGGFRSQSEAIRHGISRALLAYDPSLRPSLKKAGYLTRDPREKERKKYGFHKARRGRQFRKR